MNVKKNSSDKSIKRYANGTANINSSPEKIVGNEKKRKNQSSKKQQQQNSNKTLQLNLNNKSDENTEENDDKSVIISDDSMYYDDLDDVYSDNDPERPSGRLELRILNISKYKDLDFRTETKILSQEAIIIRCLPWKILFMLRTQTERSKCMGFFLQCNASSDSSVWHCHAKAELRLAVQRKTVNTQDLVKNIEHNFFYRENDWGYSNYITWSDLVNPEKGFLGLDDSILLRVKVQADAPHGVDWDSKKHTGFVGLKNQGATCYMNSLLQALFFTNKLRKAVYQLPTETDDEQRSVSLALQRVFYELQFGVKAVGTKRLTKSFGWETLDTFMQHDAQELCRVLLDNLESKMKGTRVEDTIPNLFCGKMMSFIRCKKVPIESKREEAFYDIQLKVKGNTDIYEAFKEYITLESLDGDNKYDAGECGLQEAEKGIVFLKFPPVLYLQLMRFQYDYEADANIKINDSFKFPYKLDLSNYLQDRSDSRTHYILHTVLVHSGDNHGGHYVAYLNPGGDNKWYKFDDDVVSRCSRREAILSNFGGNDDDSTIKQCTNAYMLVYISEADIDDILCRIDDSEIPPNLHQRFANEKHVEDQKRQEKAKAHLYSSVIVLLDEDFYGWQGYELFDVEKNTYWRRFKFPRKSNATDLTRMISETLRESCDRIRLWCVIQRNNQIQLSLLDGKDASILSSETPVMLWIQTISADSPTQSLTPIDSKQILIFCKYFDPVNNSMHFMGWTLYKVGSPVKDIFPVLRKLVYLADSIQLTLWEERGRNLTVINCNESFISPFNGMIIIFEPNVKPSYKISRGDSINNTRSLSSPILNAKDFLEDFRQKIDVEFVEKIGELTSRDTNNKPSPIRTVIRLSQKARYSEILKSLALHIHGADVAKIQLYKTSLPSHGCKTELIPGDPVRTTFEGALGDLVNSQIQPQINATLPRGKPNQNVPLINTNNQPLSCPNGNFHSTNCYRRLYFQLLKIPIHEVEAMQQFCCVFVDVHVQEQIEIIVTLPKTGNASDLLAEAKRQARLTNINAFNYRLFEVVNHRIVSLIPLKRKISELEPNPNRIIQIEAIPSGEEKVSPKTECLITIAHCQADIKQFFGVPFSMKIMDKESLTDLRTRIRVRLDCQEKEFAKWQLVIFSNHNFSFLNEENYPHIRSTMFFDPNIYNPYEQSAELIGPDCPLLCLDHKMPVTKRNRCNLSERPIKIHN